MEGFWAGIKSFPIIGNIISLAESIIRAFNSALGVESPSKKFMKSGKFAMEGFNAGLTGNSGRSSSSSSVNITVNVNGQFSNDPRAASRSVATTVLNGMKRSGSFSGAPLVV